MLLAATTTVPAALEGLRRLHAPPLLVAIAGVMWRYVFVLAGEVARMRAALAARGHRPRHLLHGAATGRLAGALFLRAHARAERVHTAMAARGWHGVPAAPPAAALARADVAFVAALAGFRCCCASRWRCRHDLRRARPPAEPRLHAARLEVPA